MQRGADDGNKLKQKTGGESHARRALYAVSLRFADTSRTHAVAHESCMHRKRSRLAAMQRHIKLRVLAFYLAVALASVALAVVATRLESDGEVIDLKIVHAFSGAAKDVRQDPAPRSPWRPR